MKQADAVERHRVLAWLSEVAPLLGMAHYDIILERKACGRDSDAETNTVKDTYRMHLSLGPHWMSLSPKRKTLVLLHELMHGLLGPMSTKKRHADEERICDGLASSLRPLVPQFPGTGHTISHRVHDGDF